MIPGVELLAAREITPAAEAAKRTRQKSVRIRVEGCEEGRHTATINHDYDMASNFFHLPLIAGKTVSTERKRLSGHLENREPEVAIGADTIAVAYGNTHRNIYIAAVPTSNHHFGPTGHGGMHCMLGQS